MNKKIILYIIVGIIVLLLSLSSFGMISFNPKEDINADTYQNLPEKCRPTAGQDINAWKEHLGHHTETQDCLKYFK